MPPKPHLLPSFSANSERLPLKLHFLQALMLWHVIRLFLSTLKIDFFNQNSKTINYV